MPMFTTNKARYYIRNLVSADLFISKFKILNQEIEPLSLLYGPFEYYDTNTDRLDISYFPLSFSSLNSFSDHLIYLIKDNLGVIKEYIDPLDMKQLIKFDKYTFESLKNLQIVKIDDFIFNFHNQEIVNYNIFEHYKKQVFRYFGYRKFSRTAIEYYNHLSELDKRSFGDVYHLPKIDIGFLKIPDNDIYIQSSLTSAGIDFETTENDNMIIINNFAQDINFIKLLQSFNSNNIIKYQDITEFEKDISNYKNISVP